MRVRLRVGPAIWLALLLWSAEGLQAQGVTGAAIQGTVGDSGAAAVQEAVVLVTNTSTGERWQTTSRANGRFFIEHLSVGGPYRIEVHAVGFAPRQQEGLFLSLGQRYSTAFTLHHTAIELAEVTVQAALDPLINPGRTGPAQIVSDTTILRLPSARDYTDLARLAPQVELRELRALLRRAARPTQRAAGGRHHQQRPLQHQRDRQRHDRGLSGPDHPHAGEPGRSPDRDRTVRRALWRVHGWIGERGHQVRVEYDERSGLRLFRKSEPDRARLGRESCRRFHPR